MGSRKVSATRLWAIHAVWLNVLATVAMTPPQTLPACSPLQGWVNPPHPNPRQVTPTSNFWALAKLLLPDSELSQLFGSKSLLVMVAMTTPQFFPVPFQWWVNSPHPTPTQVKPTWNVSALAKLLLPDSELSQLFGSMCWRRLLRRMWSSYCSGVTCIEKKSDLIKVCT